MHPHGFEGDGKAEAISSRPRARLVYTKERPKDIFQRIFWNTGTHVADCEKDLRSGGSVVYFQRHFDVCTRSGEMNGVPNDIFTSASQRERIGVLQHYRICLFPND